MLVNTPDSLSPATFYSIEYISEPPLIRGRTLRPLQSEEITVVCEWLLDAAQAYRCPYWLLDGRAHAREHPQSLHDWLREEYLPRVRQSLGQRPSIAVLVPHHVWEGLPARGYIQPQEWHSPAAFLGWFTEEASALVWLARQRP